MHAEDRQYTLNEFLRHVSHITDLAYQRRIWIRNEGPECQAFDDAVCDFFDIGDPILSNYKKFGITEIQYNSLIRLRQQFKDFTDTHDCPEDFIDTPEWAQIMKLAKDVLVVFNVHYK